MSDVGSVREWASVANEYEGNAKDQNIVRFFNKILEDSKRHEIEGGVKFKEVPYIEIFAPGQFRNTCIQRKATDEDKARYPIQWAKFERASDEVVGTPLEEWPYLKRVQVAEFKSLGFPTVESIAGASESSLVKLGMGARELQKRAQQFLKPQSDAETELREQVVSLKAELKKTEAERDHWKQVAESKPRGRPRKVRDEDDSTNGLSDGA